MLQYFLPLTLDKMEVKQKIGKDLPACLSVSLSGTKTDTGTICFIFQIWRIDGTFAVIMDLTDTYLKCLEGTCLFQGLRYLNKYQ